MQRQETITTIPDQPNKVDPMSITIGLDSIIEQVKKLEHDSYILGCMRATLVLNFGPDGVSEKNCGVTIDDPEEKKPHALLVLVLEKLVDKISKLSKELDEKNDLSKWRKAKPGDLEEGRRRARFRNDAKDEWVDGWLTAVRCPGYTHRFQREDDFYYKECDIRV